jgi:GNAT superfamily N-acetyltransferase
MAQVVCHLIRKASERDAARIAEIHVRSWQAAYRGLIPDAYLDSLDPVHRALAWKGIIGAPEELVLVALRGSRIVGFCSLLPSRDPAAPREIAEISSLYVEPREWRKGVGASLVGAALDHAAKHGFVAVTLWVLTSNARALRFYGKLGFDPDGTIQDNQRLGFPIQEARFLKEL